MKKIKFIVLSLLTLALVAPTAINAEDSAPVETAGGNGTSDVTFTVDENNVAKFSVTVPLVIPMSYNADGTVLVPQNAAIKNGSSGAITVTNIAINNVGDWTVRGFDELNAEIPTMAGGTKDIAFMIDNAKTQEGEANLPEDFKDTLGLIPKSQEVILNLGAIVAPQITKADATNVAQVVFTLDWYTGNTAN